MASDKALPFRYQFAAGGIAGVSEVGPNPLGIDSADKTY